MDVFPAIFPLSGVTVAVAGDGEAAEAKARLLEGSPAILRHVTAADAGRAESYAGARLVFIALAEDAARDAAAAARAAGALVNVVDRPELCDFTTPAIVDRGAVVAAVATGGAAPMLAAELRTALEAQWPERLGELATLIGALQPEVRAALPDAAARRAWLRRSLLDGEAATLALDGRREAALVEARRSLRAPDARRGRLLVLTPPASPDLLSLRALRALGRADRVVAVPGVDAALLSLARRDAPRHGWDQIGAADVQAWLGEGETILAVGPADVFMELGPFERLPTTG